MTLIAPHITAFLQQRLPVERRASPNNCDSYAHAFKLLFEYVSASQKIRPCELNLEQIDAPLIVNFLGHLESVRGKALVPGTSALPPSSRSCTSWSTESPQRCSRFSAFSLFQLRKPILALFATSPLTRCSRSWMLPTRRFEPVSEIGRCCICVSPEVCAFLS